MYFMHFMYFMIPRHIAVHRPLSLAGVTCTAGMIMIADCCCMHADLDGGREENMYSADASGPADACASKNSIGTTGGNRYRNEPCEFPMPMDLDVDAAPDGTCGGTCLSDFALVTPDRACCEFEGPTLDIDASGGCPGERGGGERATVCDLDAGLVAPVDATAAAGAMSVQSVLSMLNTATDHIHALQALLPCIGQLQMHLAGRRVCGNWQAASAGATTTTAPRLSMAVINK